MSAGRLCLALCLLIVLQFAGATDAPKGSRVSSVLIESSLTHPQVSEDLYSKIIRPVIIKDPGLLARVDALINGKDVQYLPALIVPERPVLLLDKDGEILAAFKYSPKGKVDDAFFPCRFRREGNNYYIGHPLAGVENVIQDGSGRFAGYNNAKQLLGFATLIKSYIDIYEMEPVGAAERKTSERHEPTTAR